MENGTIINQYKIISAIGKGGMGEVWLAEDTRLARQVALKLLPAEFTQDAERVRRFMQEAKAASALNHPNIITVYDIGESDAGRFIVMELVAGRTLREIIATDNSLETFLPLSTQIAKALSAAHAAGITHRDLKPDNILVREDGYVKVLDFGLARLLTTNSGDSEAATLAQQTTPGTIMGTVAYMSPEQARGESVGPQSDIFALGIVLYELATGRHPFQAETLVGYLHAITLQEPAPPQQWQPKLPAALNALILRMLSKDASQRPTANEIAQTLVKAEHRSHSTDNDPIVAQTLIQPQATAAAPEALATAAVSAQPTSPDHPKPKQWWLAAGLSLLLAVGGFFGYKYFSPTKQIESIAVMPFVNESKNEEVEYLSDGMTETLIKSLSNLPNLNVKPRSSVFRYKGKDTDLKTIGKELNVEAILNGRVIQRGEQLTLSLELVDVQNDKVLWTESYQRKQSDIVTLQSEIAKDVSTKLKSKLSGADEAKVTKTSTANPEAYQAYLKGRYYWNRRTAENLKKAIEQFKAATDRDPNYALAYAGLADCYVVLNQYAGTPLTETIPQVKAYAERAISIDGQLAEPHTSLGAANDQLGQWAEAEREYKRAIELNPNYATAFHWYSDFLRNIGRTDEAVPLIMRAHEIDPLSSVISGDVAVIYQIQNNHPAAIETCLKIIEIDPAFSNAYQYLGLSYLKVGRNAEALITLEKAVELSKRDGEKLRYLGYGFAIDGKRAQAYAILKELEDKYVKKEANGRDVASVYAGLSEKDKAFEWLEKDFQTRAGEFSPITWEVPFKNLRDDPRYKDLLKRMGLPE